MAAGREREISNRFTYHPPAGDQPERYVKIRQLGGDFARFLLGVCPASPELDRAIDAVDDAVKHANAAIARHERGAYGIPQQYAQEGRDWSAGYLQEQAEDDS